MSFILRPATDRVLDTTIEWDVESTPSGTRAACSLGEGIRVSAQIKATDLDECFFAVGPLHSYPRGETGEPFGIYWLSDSPFDAGALGAKTKALSPRMVKFFDDPDPTYRVFIRRNIQKCVSGRGQHGGFVYAWTMVVPRDIDEVLIYETVHNWPRLGHSVGGPTMEEMADGWFNEGIAEYYSLVLPFRSGIFSGQDFVRRINIRIPAYYTNPDRTIKNKDVQDRFWVGGHINRIPYQRGFMKRAGARSLDQLIINMVHPRRQEQPHNIPVWNSMLEKQLGPATETSYQEMSVVLVSVYLRVVEGLDWTLLRQDQEEFCLGFDEASLSPKGGVVMDLIPTSRVPKQGCRWGASLHSSTASSSLKGGAKS
ncbi:putative Peptidase M61 catalytic domain-containing protein [Seiridium cardinale]|uniref:Peptidase M61 catalytic domain-containing protein n=1 Tax=Seiridium cardinale TaxID=138064 RepID=A0ABR2XTF7_9PEZI